VLLSVVVPPQDSLGHANHLDNVELIGATRDKATVLYSGSPGEQPAFSVPLTVPSGGIVLRARGRRGSDGPSALMFYTNPIRIDVR
jgi:hypothetical protein